MTTPLRVFFVTHSSAPAGAELGLLRILPHLVECGIEPHLCLGAEGPIAAAARALDVAVHVDRLPSAVAGHRREQVRPALDAIRMGPAVAEAAWRLARLCRTLRPDLVQASSMKALVYASAAARITGTRLTWEIHDIPRAPYMSGRTRRFLGALAIGARPAGVLVHSSAVAGALPGGLRGSVVPYAAALDRPAAPPRESGPLRLGMAARLAPWKGQMVAVRALPSILRAHPGAELWLAGAALFGEGAYERELNAEIRRLGLGASVRMLGHVPDPVAFYGDVDIAVHASVMPEPFGITLLDAFAAGRPAVATDGGGVREVAGESDAATVVPPGDPERLASAVLEMAAAGRPALAARGAIARARAEQFAPAAVAERTASFLRSHARRGRG